MDSPTERRRFLIDICHPAHVHFFRHPLEILQERGHEVRVTSRDKDVTLALLDQLAWTHEPLSVMGDNSRLGMLTELTQRNAALYRRVRQFRPHAMAAVGGIFIAQVGFLTRTPSLVFYDTENARLQNLLTYPFASQVIAPRCYGAWLPGGARRYAGYHELSYLHPARFTADRELAVANGIDRERDTFLIRLVAWQANHDVGERGWTVDLLDRVVNYLAPRGKVIISSEALLPEHLQPLAYRGDPLQLHHVLAHSRLHLGESATMVSEAAVLGIPAIYAATTGRGYTTEQQQLYRLVENIHTPGAEPIISAIEDILAVPVEKWAQRRRRLLADTIDVAAYTANLIERCGRTAPL